MSRISAHCETETETIFARIRSSLGRLPAGTWIQDLHHRVKAALNSSPLDRAINSLSRTVTTSTGMKGMRRQSVSAGTGGSINAGTLTAYGPARASC